MVSDQAGFRAEQDDDRRSVDPQVAAPLAGERTRDGLPDAGGREAMTVASVGTDSRLPVVRLVNTQAALSGSTDRMAGRGDPGWR